MLVLVTERRSYLLFIVIRTGYSGEREGNLLRLRTGLSKVGRTVVGEKGYLATQTH